ncbi:MAG: hypothetical protein WC621_02220 [Patescibacteria group bacterium]
MPNIVIYGVIIALLVGIVGYRYFKDKGKNANQGFAWGFLSTLAVTATAAVIYFFKKKKAR